MSTLNAKLSDLRTFLHAPPSPDVWKRLWHHLGTWRHQPGFAIACDYTSQVLATWPDALRCASEAELDDDDPRWTLVRTLHLRGDRLDSSLLGKLQAITGIHLDQIAPAQRVLDPAQTPHLHTLHLRGAAWADTLPDLLRWRTWSRLDHLSLSRCGLHDRHVVPLLERTFPALAHLDLSSNPLTDRSAQSLAETGPQRRQLRTLNLGRTRITEVGIAAVLHGLTRLTALGLDGLDLPSAIWGEVVQSSLVGNHPRLDSLRDRHLGDAPIEMLARSPRLARVRHLDLTGNDLTGRAIKALVESPYLHHLTTLALAHNAIDAPSVQMLLNASDTFPQLTHLDLTYNQTGDRGASNVGRSAQLPRLTHFDLRYNTIGDAGAEGLGHLAQQLPQLKHLDLRGNPIRDKGAQALAEAFKDSGLHTLKLDVQHLHEASLRTLAALPALAQLSDHQTLSQFRPDSDTAIFEHHQMGDTGAMALARSPHLRRLRRLALVGNRIGDLGAIALASSPHLKQLEHLELGSNAIGFEGIRALATSTTLRSLSSLDLSNNQLDAQTLPALFHDLNHPQLTHLDLSHNQLDAQAAQWLSEQKPLIARLVHLNLSHNRLGPDAMASLSGAQLLSGVLELNLSHNHVGDLGVEHLVASPHLTALQRLDLSHNAITPIGASILAQSPSMGPLAHLNLGDNPLGDRGMIALTSVPTQLVQLAQLELDFQHLTSQGWIALAQAPFWANCPHLERFAHHDLTDTVLIELVRSPHLSGVRHLDLSGNQLTAATLDALRSAEHATHLEHLELAHNPLQDDGCALLAAYLHQHTQLRTLNLSHAWLTDVGLQHLLERPVPHLTRLDLSWNALTDAGCTQLTHSAHLPHLTELDLSGSALTDRGVVAVLSSPMAQRLNRLGLRHVPMSVEALQAIPRGLELSYMAQDGWEGHPSDSDSNISPPQLDPAQSPVQRSRRRPSKPTPKGSTTPAASDSETQRKKRIEERQEAKRVKQRKRREQDKKRAQQRRRKRNNRS